MENNKLIDNLDFLNKEELEDLGEYFKLASRIGFLQEYKKMFKDKGYGEYGSLVNAIMNKVKHDPNKELSLIYIDDIIKQAYHNFIKNMEICRLYYTYNIQKSKEYFSKAKELKPNNPSVLYNEQFFK